MAAAQLVDGNPHRLLAARELAGVTQNGHRQVIAITQGRDQIGYHDLRAAVARVINHVQNTSRHAPPSRHATSRR